MPPPCDIVRYEPALREQAIRLQRHLWSPDGALNAAYFKWKYEDNPNAPDGAIYLALCEGEVVAMRGFVGARWQAGPEGGLKRAACACDLVVSPEWRGRGIDRTLMQHALRDLARRGHEVVLSFSASPYTMLSSLRAGWRLLVPYRFLHWEDQRKAVARALHDRLGRAPVVWRYADQPIPLLERHASRAGARLARRLGAKTRARQVSIDVAREPDVASMAALARRNGRCVAAIRQFKDERFFKWRFANPMSEYTFLYAGQGSPAGYLVLRLPRARGAADAAIVDFEVDAPEVLADMIVEVQESGALDSLTLWSCGLPPAVLAALTSRGFTETDASRGIKGYTPGLLVRMLRDTALPDQEDGNPCRSALAQARDWDLRMIDSDFY